jgi:hypothetical protein
MFAALAFAAATCVRKGQLPDGDGLAAFFDFGNLPTEHRGTIALMALPKTWLTFEDLLEVMHATGQGKAPRQEPGPETDVLVLAENEKAYEVAACFLLSLEQDSPSSHHWN